MLIMSQNLKPRLLEAATKVTYFTTKAVKMMEVLQLSIIHSQSSGFLMEMSVIPDILWECRLLLTATSVFSPQGNQYHTNTGKEENRGHRGKRYCILNESFLGSPGKTMLGGCLLWPASSGHLDCHLATTRGLLKPFDPFALGMHLAFLR